MNACGYLPTGDGHLLYWERHGTPGTQPLMFLHGGPGGSTYARHLAFFDLARVDLLMFHQRGCGRSMPAGGLQHNSTERLLLDIERLRRFHRLGRLLVLGVSWGGWLALAYRQRYPDAVSRVVAALAFIPFPALVQAYHRQLQDNLGEPLHGVCERLHATDATVRHDAATAWVRGQMRMAGRTADPHKLAAFVDEAAVRAIRLELHYHLHHYFVTDPAAHVQLDERVHLIQAARSPVDMQGLEGLRQLGRFQARVIDSDHDPFHPLMLASIRQALAQGS
jgi:pimeloyl-ACP methyl ester carboxylesterase